MSEKWGYRVPLVISYCPPMDLKDWWIGNFITLYPDATVSEFVEGRNRNRMDELNNIGLC